jgi:hypothetical protein
VRQFAALTVRDRDLLLRGLVLVAAVRLALWTLPFRRVRSFFAETRHPVSPVLASIRVTRLAWAVQAAAKRIPGASCLTQALSLQYLLARAGRSAQVRIGVAIDRSEITARAFESHAWVEYRGEVILGNNGELERYRLMLDFCTEEL